MQVREEEFILVKSFDDMHTSLDTNTLLVTVQTSNTAALITITSITIESIASSNSSRLKLTNIHYGKILVKHSKVGLANNNS